MKGKIGVVFLLFVCSAFLLAPTAEAQKKVYQWKVAMGLSKYKGHMPTDDFIKAVEKATKGQIKMQYLQPGEHPYSPVDVFKAVRDNVMQIGFTMNIYTQSIMPQMGLQELPFLFSGGPEEFLAMTKDPECRDIWDYVLLDPLSQWNQMLLGWFVTPGYMFAGPKWVDDLDSWKGLRARAYSKPIADMLKVLNAVPVNVSWDEVSTALSRNMLDCVLTAVIGAYPAKLYEFPTVKWVTMVDWAVGIHWVTMNKKAFNDLPKSLQDIILQECQKQQPLYQGAVNNNNYIQTYKMMEEYGVKTKFMDPRLIEQVRMKMQPIYEQYSKEMGEKGPAMIKRINAFHEKYVKLKK